ncbi:MAG: hypothetical protein HEP71_17230 [Roseivirga sp.]|nr:hypothetical protein [Roseivirga sp.]
MEDKKYIEDLSHIKEVMNRSSRSISLTGLSPIAAGIIGAIGAYLAYSMFFRDYGAMGYEKLTLSAEHMQTLNLLVWPTLVLGLGSGLLFALLKIRRSSRNISPEQIRRMFVNLFVPLVAGGLACLVLFTNGYIIFVLGLSLIFYGLALINTDKYTFDDIKTLGLLEIILGLTALYLPDYGIIFWGIGFGLLQIIYGLIMQTKSSS